MRAIRACVAGAALLAAMAFAGRAAASPFDDVVEDHRVASDPKATQSVREEAQYSLARRLYGMRFHQSALGLFAAIADKPEHAAFMRTLPWLARLESDLPRPADVDERLAKYDDRAIEANHLELHRGRWAFTNHRYEDAIRWFAKVPRGSTQYPRAWFYAGVANVHLKRAPDAVAAWKRVVSASDAATANDGPDDEYERLRDFAMLGIARTFYSAKEYAAALEWWRAVDETGESWADALYEQSWALFMTGDHARALGNLHALNLEWLPQDWKPEAEHLRALVYLANCEYEDARTLAARFEGRYRPIAKELAALKLDDEAAFAFLRDVRNGKDTLSPATRHAVISELSDRELLRHLQYVAVLDDEKKRLVRAPPSFRDSKLGGDLKDAIDLARDIAVRNGGHLTRARLERARGELERLLGENAKILVAARPDVGLRMPADNDRNVVRGDDEHVIWPFTGELWADEAGSLRQSIRSKCR